jgi:hypothetical protein
MNADGSGQANLVGDDATDDADPVFSPDGTTIAFTRRDASDAKRLMTIPAGGGGPTAVTVAASEVEGPVWARSLTKVRVSEKVSARRVHVHGRLLISGAVKPAVRGRITLTITRSGRRVAKRKAKLSHRRYKVSFRPRTAGRYRVVATLPAGDGHLQAVSSSRSFLVQR